MSRLIRALGALSLTTVAAGCSGGLDVNADAGLQLQVATVNGNAPAASAPETIAVGTDVIVLQSVQLVLRQIELEGAEGACADSTLDDCAEVEIGPMIVDLPLDGGAEHAISAQVPAGVYDEIKFKVHRPESGSADDQAFIQAHPTFADVSIRVTGTWNGEPFVYEAQQGYEQEISLATPLVVTDAAAHLTLATDVGIWFVNEAGSGLVDPRLALTGLAFESLVEHNIELSFEAFEDDDRDGQADN